MRRDRETLLEKMEEVWEVVDVCMSTYYPRGTDDI